MTMFSAEWIKSTDELLSRRGVPVKRRPWDAWGEWSKLSGPSRMDSPEAQAIFKWYTKEYERERFAIGSLFTGALYFDQVVWPVYVPICYGTVSVSINKMVDSMPPLVRDRMYKDATAINNLVAVGADCIDYGLGFDYLRGGPLPTTLAMEMLVSADKELRSSVELLLSDRPTQKAAEAARLATEMFLKCFLAHHAGANAKALRDEVGHRLDEALARCLNHSPQSDLRVLNGQFGHFPAIGDRYAVRERSLKDLWICYSLAQVAGACVVRSVTDRDVRRSINVNWEPGE